MTWVLPTRLHCNFYKSPFWNLNPNLTTAPFIQMIDEEACHIMAILGFIFLLFLWLTVTFHVTPSIHSHLFPFILIHFRSSFYLFPFPVHFPVMDSYALVLIPSGLLFYALALVHVMCPSSRPFRISLVRNRYIVASLFWLCTLLVLYFCIFLVVLFDSLFRQLYSLLVPLVWDQLERAPFFQSLVPPFPFHLEFAPSSSLLLPGCCSSP